MALTDNLLSFWNLNELTGTTSYDSIGNVDGVNTNTFHANGKIGNGAGFYASTNDSAYIDFGTTYNFEKDESFSISMWFKKDNSTLNGTLISNLDSTGKGYAIYFNNSNSNLAISLRTDAFNYTIGYNNCCANTDWNHIVFTYDGSGDKTGIKLYANGENKPLTFFAPNMGASIVSTSSLRLGLQEVASMMFNGVIDEVGIWNRVLTSGETISLYNNGDGVVIGNMPIDLIVSGSTQTSIDLKWTNNAITSIDNNIVQLYSGGTWNDVATLSSGSTTYTYTGLTTNTSYKLRVSARKSTKDYSSEYVLANTTPYKPYIFNSTSKIYIPDNIVKIDYLIVGAGGGGGSSSSFGSGGGGAGGMLEGTIDNPISGVYDVTVGIGGIGNIYGSDEFPTRNGGNSSFSGLTAIGGGKGGTYKHYPFTGTTAYSGGSGGGGAIYEVGGARVNGQGNIGGTGNNQQSGGAGGGGASSAGSNSSGGVAGNGGSGKSSSISGSAVTYAKGGDGSDSTKGGNSGADNTGNGGDGGRMGVNEDGCIGGSGIVILKLYSNEIPIVTTTSITNIDYTSATGGGNVTNEGYPADVTSRGICWNTTGNPTTGDSKTTNGTGGGSFVSNLTGLTINTTYYVRAYAINATGIGYGNEVNFTTLNLELQEPTGLTITNTECLSATINWVNNNISDVIGNYVQQLSGSTWVTIATVSSGTTSYDLTGLTKLTEYTYRITVYNLDDSESSTSISFTTPECPLLPSFCSSTNYLVSGSTCGNSDGSVEINDIIYLQYYDFTLTDINNNIFPFDTNGVANNLPSGYYFLTAVVKPEYWYYYGREACTFEWLKVNDVDTSMSNTGISVRNVICGGFGKSQGRIAYLCEDIGLNAPYTANIYDEQTHELISTVTGSTIDTIIFVPLNAGNYYTHITNAIGCSLLIGSTKVSGESLRSVAGIKTLWLTKWSNLVEYDYWTQSDEDYYLSGLDANFFNSIKIKRFVDSTLPDFWYAVNVQTKAITFQQVMQKTKQSFVFTDKLVLTIPHADNAKWRELTDILKDRYILVFVDNNGEYWCTGYKYGAKIQAYKRENNEYMLEFNAISDNKLLTSLDKNYVKNNIL